MKSCRQTIAAVAIVLLGATSLPQSAAIETVIKEDPGREIKFAGYAAPAPSPASAPSPGPAAPAGLEEDAPWYSWFWPWWSSSFHLSKAVVKPSLRETGAAAQREAQDRLVASTERIESNTATAVSDFLREAQAGSKIIAMHSESVRRGKHLEKELRGDVRGVARPLLHYQCVGCRDRRASILGSLVVV